MAWTFRRKIKIASGVHINFSKSGISTSVGTNGVTVTVGPNGTYLYAGIPGSGLYNRQKLDFVFQPVVPDTSSHLSPQGGFPSSNGVEDNGGDKNKGCLRFFMWILCILSGVLVLGGILSVVDTKKELQSKNSEQNQLISQQNLEVEIQDFVAGETCRLPIDYTCEDELQGNIEDLQNSLTQYYTQLALVIVLFIFSIIWLVRQSLFEPSKSLSDAETSKNLQNIRILITNTENPLKRKILNNHLGYLIQQDADKRLKPLIEKWAKKVKKNSDPKIKEQFHIYEKQYGAAVDEVKSLVFRVEDELSDEEKKAYADFCESFRAFRSCRKVWKILFSARNAELKSSAYTTVQKSSANLKVGIFDELSSSYGVPVFPVSGDRAVYFYPRFVVVGKTISDFDVKPIDQVDLEYKSTRFIEDGIRPTDAKQVDTTYRYINKNGGPDRRYSYNPVLPILLYGDITLQPYGDTFQVSNNDAAMKLGQAFKALKSSYAVNTKSVGNGRKEMHREESSKSRGRDLNISPDSLLKYAATVVVTTQNASISVLQRNLEIGFNRAGRIMSQLEALGIVGPQIGISPRDVFVKDLSEVDNILDSVYKTPEHSGPITEQYFDDLVSAAKRLLDFGERLANNSDFCKVVSDSVVGEIKWNGQMLIEAKDKVPIFLWIDVIHCYMGLGHEIDLASDEGLGLLIYNVLMTDPSFPVEYSYSDLIRAKLKGSVEEFIHNGVSSMKGDTNCFVLEVCLKDFDNQLHNQYIVLLYRFASLIAKADKKISEKETDWLNKIMALKISEGIEDVIEPAGSMEGLLCKKKESAKKICSDAAKELDGLIGLSSVKSEITSLTNYIKVQKMREEKGMKVPPVSLHCIFTGNPGTGKTTVARIVAEIYKELGLLKKGHLVETDRSGLVAEYVGQTAVKTNKIIDSALDGILFIDEAYSLVDGGNSDYGKEAIATLLKRMEDSRDRLVVILAGYTDDMRRFIDSNPGFQSRFNRYIEFPDYSAEELYRIFCSSVKKYEYTLADEAQEVLKKVFEDAVSNKDRNFGNGRFARNLFEKVVEQQANRLSSEAEVTAETLATIEAADIQTSL